MLDLFIEWRRQRRRLAVCAATLALLFTLILVSPKNMRWADPLRFIETIAVALVAISGSGLLVLAWRRYAATRLALRYSGAARPVTVAVRFLLDERHAARRWMLPALLAGSVATFLSVLSAWPQVAYFRPFQNLFQWVAVAAFAVMVLAPIRHRTNSINSVYLRQYIAQICRYTKFKPLTMREAKRRIAALLGPAVVRTKDGVRAGGFIWQFSDYAKGGALILGQAGAGKTVALLHAILESFFLFFDSTHLKLGGLLQDVKGDFKLKCERVCAKYGREGDLRIFDLLANPEKRGAPHSIIWNPLDTDAAAMEVAAALFAGAEYQGMKSLDSFFIFGAKDCAARDLTLLRAGLPSGETPSVFHLYRLANERPRKPSGDEAGAPIDDGSPPTLFEELCANIVGRWPDRTKLPQAIADALTSRLLEWDHMPDRQRAGIVGTLNQVLSPFMSEPIRHFVTGKSTLSMQEIVDRNIILYVHAPLAMNPEAAIIINTSIKIAYQNEIRKRLNKENPSFYLCDEFHNLFLPGANGDARFFSLSRESNHANVVATQNLPLLYQRSKNKHEVTSLLGNCSTIFFLRNTEPETSEFASKLFGEISSITVSPSESANFGQVFRRSTTSYSRSTTSNRAVPPETFAGLAIPVRDDPSRQYTQTIVHLGTRAVTQRLDLLWKVHPL